MVNEQEWMDDFTGPVFENVSTEFHFHKLAREIDAIDDIEVVKQMFKQHLMIHLKEKEMWKKLTTSYANPINTEE
jgi:hypothetical protein